MIWSKLKTQDRGLQDLGPRTHYLRIQTPRSRTVGRRTKESGPETLGTTRCRTWDPYTDYLIPILLYFTVEKTVVIDDNFP